VTWRSRHQKPLMTETPLHKLIHCQTGDDREEAFWYVRPLAGGIALAVSIREDGDLEVLMTREQARGMIGAIEDGLAAPRET
jgi:hypothetical protein